MVLAAECSSLMWERLETQCPYDTLSLPLSHDPNALTRHPPSHRPPAPFTSYFASAWSPPPLFSTIFLSIPNISYWIPFSFTYSSMSAISGKPLRQCLNSITACSAANARSLSKSQISITMRKSSSVGGEVSRCDMMWSRMWSPRILRWSFRLLEARWRWL